MGMDGLLLSCVARKNDTTIRTGVSSALPVPSLPSELSFDATSRVKGCEATRRGNARGKRGAARLAPLSGARKAVVWAAMARELLSLASPLTRLGQTPKLGVKFLHPADGAKARPPSEHGAHRASAARTTRWRRGGAVGFIFRLLRQPQSPGCPKLWEATVEDGSFFRGGWKGEEPSSREWWSSELSAPAW